MPNKHITTETFVDGIMFKIANILSRSGQTPFLPSMLPTNLSSGVDGITNTATSLTALTAFANGPNGLC